MTTGRHPPLLVVWALVAVVAIGWALGSAPLMDQDEGRNGEVAREMAATDDYVLPHLNGLPYIDKPVLFFAATAVVMELLGPTELAARTVPFACAILTALLVGLAGGRWYGREPGWVAGIAAIAAPLPLAFARIVILDSMLALFVTCALLAFHAAVEARNEGRSGLRWTVVAWAAIGLGVLTKGPVAIALPLLVAAPYAVWRRASWAVWHPAALLVFAAVVGPWVGYMEARLPGYLKYVTVTETWQRVSSDELRRTQPWWYFVAIAAVGFFPWWPLALGRRRLAGGADPKRVFAWLWLLVPLAFLSLSRSKLPQYILPLAPAVALLVASRWPTGGRARPHAAWLGILGWSAFGVAMAAAAAGAFDGSRIEPDLLAVLPRPAMIMAGVCLAAAAAAVAALRRGHGPALVAALSLPLVALPVVLRPVISALGEHRSERSLATTIRTELPAETEVIGLQAWRPSISFYLRRPVPIVSADGDELRSNYILRTHDRWFDPDGVLRPLASAPAAGRCDQPTVLLVHAKRTDLQNRLEAAGLELLGAGPKIHAFFCDPSADAADPMASPPTPADRPPGG